MKMSMSASKQKPTIAARAISAGDQRLSCVHTASLQTAVNSLSGAGALCVAVAVNPCLRLCEMSCRSKRTVDGTSTGRTSEWNLLASAEAEMERFCAPVLRANKKSNLSLSTVCSGTIPRAIAPLPASAKGGNYLLRPYRTTCANSQEVPCTVHVKVTFSGMLPHRSVFCFDDLATKSGRENLKTSDQPARAKHMHRQWCPPSVDVSLCPPNRTLTFPSKQLARTSIALLESLAQPVNSSAFWQAQARTILEKPVLIGIATEIPYFLSILQQQPRLCKVMAWSSPAPSFIKRPRDF